MRKVIDGFIVDEESGAEFKGEDPSMFPVIAGLGKVIGQENMVEYLHEFFSESAAYYPDYPDYSDIGLGNGNGWASLEDQIKFVNFIMNKLSVKSEYGYKGHAGWHYNLICE